MTHPTSTGRPCRRLPGRAAAALYAAAATPVVLARAWREERRRARLRGLYTEIAERFERRGQLVEARQSRLRLEQYEQTWAAQDGGVR